MLSVPRSIDLLLPVKFYATLTSFCEKKNCIGFQNLDSFLVIIMSTNDVPMKSNSNGHSNGHTTSHASSITLLDQKYDNPLFYFKTTKALAVKTQIGRWCKKVMKCMEKVFIKSGGAAKTIKSRCASFRLTRSTYKWSMERLRQVCGRRRNSILVKRCFSSIPANCSPPLQRPTRINKSCNWVAMSNGTHSIVLLKSGQSFSHVTNFWDQKIEEGVNVVDFQGSQVPDTPCLNITLKPDNLIHASRTWSKFQTIATSSRSLQAPIV